MRFLRQNTAVIITLGPFFDKTDGVTLETALTITNERISFTVDLDNGSAPTLVLDNVAGAASGTSNDLNYITNCDAGLMQLELAAANVNYVGRAFLVVTDAANHVPVFHEFTILPALVYDSLMGTDNLQVDAVQILGTAWAAPATAGLPDCNLKQISTDATAADNLEAACDGTTYNIGGGAVVAASVTTKTGYALAADQAVNATKLGGTSVTGRDIGASVLLSPGTGTGQLDITGGVVKANLVQILAAAITGTAANLVASFTAFFNIASPTLTCADKNQTGDAYAEAVLVHVHAAGAETQATAAAASLVNGGFTDLLVDSIITDVAAVHVHVGTIDGHITADYGSIEKTCVDLLDDAAGGLADIHTDIGTIDTVVDGIDTIIDNIHDTDLPAVKVDTAAIKAKTDMQPSVWYSP